MARQGAKDGERHLFYAVDLTSRKLAHTAAVPARVVGLALGPDGQIYAFINDVLTRIDPKTFAFAPLGSVEKAERMAFRGNDLYLTGRALRRIPNVPALKALP
ncbi:MAG: hypothetical protein GX608_12120 [Lentisphaerae bacterium]|nr:hypothetical protein [Lentisphaerota bacterium]